MTMSRSVHDEYAERRSWFAAEVARLDRLDGRMAAARGAAFLTGVGLAVVWLATGRPSPLWLILPAAAFVAAVIAHARVLERKARADRGVRHYVRGLDRIAGRLNGDGPNGQRYRDPTHPYADDLDLFGAGSLFQRLWCGATRLGEDRLAAWLLAPAGRDTIRERQSAVEELRSRFDLRQTIGLLDPEDADGNQNVLRAWAGVPGKPMSPIIRATAVGCALLFWSGLVVWWVGRAPASWPVAAYAACLALAFSLRGRIAEAAGRLSRADAGLAHLAAVLDLIEREPVSTELLKRIRDRLATEGVPCSARIAQLHALSHRFEAALHNQFFAPVAVSLGLLIHLAHTAELWRERYGPAAPAWLDAAGEFEALLSLAGYAAEHPADPWPQIVAEGPVLIATRVGHPLLADEKCVRNDVSLGVPTRLLVVSGSNMAGKSTLMRTVGVNAVLALAGGPVRAESLILSPMQVGTVIRVADSLQSGKSFFFAAIERLKRVTGLAGGDPPLLFLLDELLAGTNSHDRRVGAEAVLRRLIADGAIGIVSTHDLALTEIADAFGTIAQNTHFRDTLAGGTMTFDYTLRPGVVDHGNALALMKLVGLIPDGAGEWGPGTGE